MRISIKGRPPGHRKVKRADRTPEITRGFFHSFDRTRLFYTTEGKGKPLIFCYGLVSSSLQWTYQIEYFRQFYKTVWFDYRGHNNSPKPKDLHTLTIETLATDVGILLDELKIDQAVLLGHSMGTSVALELYRQQPKRVAGLVLANGTGRRPLESLFHINATASFFALLRMLYDTSPKFLTKLWRSHRLDNPLLRTLFKLGGFNPHLTASEDIALFIKQLFDMDPDILINLIENYDAYDSTPWLHTVKAPTLILAGEKDHMLPLDEQELMHQLIPDSRIEIIRHGSHCSQMDLPELVNTKIEKFLEEIGYRNEKNIIQPGLIPGTRTKHPL